MCVRRQSCVCAMSEAVAIAEDGGGVTEETIQQRGGRKLLMIAHMRPMRDRLNQATWDAIKVSDFPATYLPSQCLPDSQE